MLDEELFLPVLHMQRPRYVFATWKGLAFGFALSLMGDLTAHVRTTYLTCGLLNRDGTLPRSARSTEAVPSTIMSQVRFMRTSCMNENDVASHQ